MPYKAFINVQVTTTERSLRPVQPITSFKNESGAWLSMFPSWIHNHAPLRAVHSTEAKKPGNKHMSERTNRANMASKKVGGRRKKNTQMTASEYRNSTLSKGKSARFLQKLCPRSPKRVTRPPFVHEAPSGAKASGPWSCSSPPSAAGTINALFRRLHLSAP